MAVVALPILIPLFLIVTLLVIKSDKIARWTGVAGSAILLVISVYIFILVRIHGILVLQAGGWEAPYGITLVADYLSILMILFTSLISLPVAIYALHFLPENISPNRFYIFFFALLTGLNGTYVTGDLFNLFVWFEVILISSFVLITLGYSKEQLEGGIKYLALNLLGSLFLLAGTGLLYAQTGTLNMAHLAEILKNSDQIIITNSAAILFFVAFGIKSAIFPLYFWLPASYHTLNITVISLFSGLLTVTGVYTLIRFFTLFFPDELIFWHKFLLIIAGLTMLSGGLAEVSHYDIRRILSYHIISQTGYILMGLGIFTPLALAGSVFFTLHNMVAKTNTFLIAGIINRAKGSYYLKDLGGLFKQSPLLAILFSIPAFALAGVPPVSGFFAKFILLKAGLENGNYIIIAVAVITAMFTLYSMIKIWNEAFLKVQPGNKKHDYQYKPAFTEYFPSLFLGTISILLGVFAYYIFECALEAANQLTDNDIYINAVMKGIKP